MISVIFFLFARSARRSFQDLHPDKRVLHDNQAMLARLIRVEIYQIPVCCWFGSLGSQKVQASCSKGQGYRQHDLIARHPYLHDHGVTSRSSSQQSSVPAHTHPFVTVDLDVTANPRNTNDSGIGCRNFLQKF